MKLDTQNIFVYGTLLFPDVQKVVMGEEVASVEATLSGYRRAKLLGRDYPGIISSPDGQVVGRLLLNIRSEALALLDMYEGFEYQRIEVVAIAETPTPALTYAWALSLDEVGEEDWDPVAFQRDKLRTFVQYIIKDYREPTGG